MLLATGLCALALSAVRPHDYFTWGLEVAPILIGVPILVATSRRQLLVGRFHERQLGQLT